METSTPNSRIRLATFNIKHSATSSGYRGNPEQAAMACAELKADVLALQEVDQGVIRSKRTDLAALAAEASGMKAVFAQTMKFRFGRYGNALLVRGEIEDVSILGLLGGPRFKKKISGRMFKAGYEPRNAIMATAIVGEKRLSVAATHLSTDKKLNRTQLHIVADALASRIGPRVLMGDFNRTRQQVLETPPLEQYDLTAAEATFPSANPTKSIDHIAVSGLAICSAAAVRLSVSDHLALVVDAEFKNC